MASLSEADAAQLQAHLQDAVVSCSERGLYQSAKWAAELLSSLPASEYGSETDPDSSMADVQPTSLKSPKTPPQWDATLEARERNKYLLAKSFFDCREFDRCAALFLPYTLPKVPIATGPEAPRAKQDPKGKAKTNTPTVPPIQTPLKSMSRRSLFLALYAKYLSGEKRKDEESEMILGPQDGGMTVNKELTGLSSTLESWFTEQHEKGRDGGGWLEYLYGIILARQKNEELAKKWLVQSVHLYPYNWGAWQELASLMGTVEQLTAILEHLPQNIMTFIFHVYANQELYQSAETIHAQLTQISSLFPASAFLKTQRALLFYHSKDFETASQIFTTLLHTHPHRLDSLDVFSNILYVMSNRPLLSFLAHLSTATDKFRPETCCIVGNYYSMLSAHEKSVVYFRRALSLDRSFAGAWTLMGHEYVEMKNTHAAIESYRRAVEINRRDYRAWYGLGQTYEFLEQYSYAIFYFQRAAALRPFDPKMWGAIGACLHRTGKYENAIRAYKRALVAGSYYEGAGASFASVGDSQGSAGKLGGGVLDPEVLFQIAVLYQRISDIPEAAAYMEMCLAQEEGPESPGGGGGGEGAETVGMGGVGVTETTSKARKWLSRYEFDRGSYQQAMEYANELCQDGVDVEDAKALVRDIRSRVEMLKDAGTSRDIEDVERRFGRAA
ncbi:anaphase-promoting complex subunit CDC23 [Eremomyces bilateralis CBS 781.70]|uniref:Anaphase-promoting complex subunit CDC23 n=1 Tax=Eremomyces bilateralis CBS 781.70 TaxID=1392243 RepID=A0A6G1FVA5_9PEZI|nr:anaphase-promoting complex subunit CDC23 [Eremomyces bilateralis CBS 781.70]KAF1809638.1 anaphase-promoting complex subunit CDC23 [Eremomyces bilateralis CBS 781.70]